ncbi:MAG: DUF2303 family protein, partial [Alphaproteobacteria bacterium]
SAIFVSDVPQRPWMKAIIDYDGQGEDANPSLRTHTATYAFPLSDEFLDWMATTLASEGLTQADFAAFLQNRGRDIANP